jgi:hypothetical protein
MKRLALILLASLFIASPVFAAPGDVVYIYEEDGKIYYDSSRLDGHFMHHEGMIPGGDRYMDELTIENATSNDYDVYFQITGNDNSPRAEELLDHIEMSIWLGDSSEPMYVGRALGLDYYERNVNLSNAVLLKHFEAGESLKMRVETYLDATYEDIDNPDMSTTKWHFYVADEPEPTPEPTPIEPEEVIPNPRTSDDFTPVWFIVLGVSIAVFVGISIRERISKKDEE